MKKVPITTTSTFSNVIITFPKNVCVSCAGNTDKTTSHSLGYSNVWIKTSYPFCERCAALGKEMNDFNDKVRKASGFKRPFLLGFAVPVFVVLVISLIVGLKWWTFLTTLGAIILGFFLYLLLDDHFYSKARRLMQPEWAEQHPEHPDPTESLPGIYVDFLFYGPADSEGKRRFVNALCCQCDEYADILINTPFHATLKKILDCKERAASNPRDYKAHYDCAMAYFDLFGMRVSKVTLTYWIYQAIADIDQSLKLQPDNVAAYYNRGILNFTHERLSYDYFCYGQADKAIEDFSEVIRRDATKWRAYVFRGVVNYLSRKGGDALSDFSRAIEIEPQSAEAYFNRAIVHASQGHEATAATDRQMAIAIRPTLQNKGPKTLQLP